MKDGDERKIMTAELAGFRARVAAYLVDVTGLAVVSWAVTFGPGCLLTDGEPSEILSALLAVSITLFVLGSLVYFTAMLAQRGQTLGKMLLGIKVIRTNASKLDTAAALKRFGGYVLSWLTLHLLFLRVITDRRRQGIHDHLADTYVIVVPKARDTVTQPRTCAANAGHL